MRNAETKKKYEYLFLMFLLNEHSTKSRNEKSGEKKKKKKNAGETGTTPNRKKCV